ncbi:MAG TPA: hypothetical protein VFU50_00285 [Terriglobales bacterium]|nr:hypothetical protein [Terriglobales bacterium]
MKRPMMVLAILFVAASTLSHASEMDRVAGAVGAQLGVRRTHIPMLGLAMFVGKVATAFQMPGAKLAIFEDERLSNCTLQQLESAVSSALGPEWSPFVKSISNHGGEQTWIYLRAQGKGIQMFIATAEPGEISLIEVKANERQMQRWIKDKDME